MLEYLPIFIAVVSGGALVKLIDVIWQMPSRKRDFSDGEKDRLIREVERLALEVKELRHEVGELRESLRKKSIETSGVTGAYFSLRASFLGFISCVKSRAFYTASDSDPEFIRAVQHAEDLIHQADVEYRDAIRNRYDEENGD